MNVFGIRLYHKTKEEYIITGDTATQPSAKIAVRYLRATLDLKAGGNL